MLKRIMELPGFDKYDLSSLKLIAYGAAPMPYEVVGKAVGVFDCGLMNAYGQTESTSTLTFLGPEDHQIPDGPPEEREKSLQRLRSVGRAMEDVAVVGQTPGVDEAAVVGVPDVEWGEEVKAVIVTKGSERPSRDELTAFVKQRLASYKAPRYYAFVEELPRNYLGKVLKTDLRKQHGEAQDEAG